MVLSCSLRDYIWSARFVRDVPQCLSDTLYFPCLSGHKVPPGQHRVSTLGVPPSGTFPQNSVSWVQHGQVTPLGHLQRSEFGGALGKHQDSKFNQSPFMPRESVGHTASSNPGESTPLPPDCILARGLSCLPVCNVFGLRVEGSNSFQLRASVFQQDLAYHESLQRDGNGIFHVLDKARR